MIQRRRWYRLAPVHSLVGGAAVYWCVYHVVLWHAMFLVRILQYRQEVLAGANPVSFGSLYSAFLSEHNIVLWCAIALLPIVLWDLTRHGRRILGPMRRLEATLRKMADGEAVVPLQWRREDGRSELQEAFNRVIELWNARQTGGNSPYSNLGHSDRECGSVPPSPAALSLLEEIGAMQRNDAPVAAASVERLTDNRSAIANGRASETVSSR